MRGSIIYITVVLPFPQPDYLLWFFNVRHRRFRSYDYEAASLKKAWCWCNIDDMFSSPLLCRFIAVFQQICKNPDNWQRKRSRGYIMWLLVVVVNIVMDVYSVLLLSPVTFIEIHHYNYILHQHNRSNHIRSRSLISTSVLQFWSY